MAAVLHPRLVALLAAGDRPCRIWRQPVSESCFVCAARISLPQVGRRETPVFVDGGDDLLSQWEEGAFSICSRAPPSGCFFETPSTPEHRLVENPRLVHRAPLRHTTTRPGAKVVTDRFADFLPFLHRPFRIGVDVVV